MPLEIVERKSTALTDTRLSAEANVPLPVVHFADVQPADTTLVENLLGRGALSVIYGPDGSSVALDLALSVATGRPWCGKHDVARSGVLYLALEGRAGIKDRVAAYRKAHAADLTGPVPFAVVPYPLDLLHGNDAGRVVDAAAAAAAGMVVPIGLVVVDTLSQAMAGGDEDATADMWRLIWNVAKIRHATAGHVLLVNSRGEGQLNRSRGHLELQAAADTVLETTRDAGSTGVVVRVDKQRDMTCAWPFSLTLPDAAV